MALLSLIKWRCTIVSQTFTTPQIIHTKNKISFMETLSSISYSIPENTSETHSIDTPTNSPYCTSTQNVQNTNITISLMKRCVKKPQDFVINKLGSSLTIK